jgi:hypothetical protein
LGKYFPTATAYRSVFWSRAPIRIDPRSGSGSRRQAIRGKTSALVAAAASGMSG